MADYGLKVSKAGYDVKTANIEDQIFNSSKTSFKIAAGGQVSTNVPSGSSDTVETISHSLGYIPGFLAFAQLQNTGRSYFANSLDLGYNSSFRASSDSSNLYLTYGQDSSSYTAVAYYYILVDPGN